MWFHRGDSLAGTTLFAVSAGGCWRASTPRCRSSTRPSSASTERSNSRAASWKTTSSSPDGPCRPPPGTSSSRCAETPGSDTSHQEQTSCNSASGTWCAIRGWTSNQQTQCYISLSTSTAGCADLRAGAAGSARRARKRGLPGGRGGRGACRLGLERCRGTAAEESSGCAASGWRAAKCHCRGSGSVGGKPRSRRSGSDGCRSGCSRCRFSACCSPCCGGRQWCERSRQACSRYR